jgi:tetratricopeptide repeat protein
MKPFSIRLASAAWGIAVLAAATALGQTESSKNAKTSDPFYRKYLVAGNPLDDQILSMEQKVDANPEDATLRNDFGNLLALRHFPKEAAEQYEMAAKLDKTNFIADYNLGILRETEGKTSDAISAYKKSIARKPGFPQSRFRLGRLYEQNGNLDAAVEQYAKALRIDPSMRNPRRNPLVIDSQLMYRVTLTNYERDVATVTLDRDVSFIEEPAFRRAPVDHPLSTEDVAPDEAETTPREVGPATGAAVPPADSGSAAKRPVRTSTAPAPGEPAMRSRTGPRAAPRATRPGQPVAPAGGPRPAVPEAAPTPAAEEPPASAPSAPETVPEAAPTPAPEELEPS